MAEDHSSQFMTRPLPLLEGAVTMPWDLDRYYGKSTKLPNETFLSKLRTRTDPSIPSCLFTIPMDVLEHLLDKITKRDAFRLSQTCKTFMRHPAILKAIFYEPISIKEIISWYQQLPHCDMGIESMAGPPVTWGINASTGPFVRRLAVPEWITELDVHYLTAHCPNLDTLDFTEVFEYIPDLSGWDSDEDSSSESEFSDSESGEEDIENHIWSPVLDRSPALFKNLRSVHLPYGCWWIEYNRLHMPQQIHTICLPKLLHLANHLQTLDLTCQQDPTLGLSPETRRMASARLLIEMFAHVGRGLTTLGLYDSVSTIENLDSFLQSLPFLPKLRTIKISVHRDLRMYQKDYHSSFYRHVIAPILSSPTGDYEHDTSSVLQYLSTIKDICDRGRFSLVSSDCGENYPSRPRKYYGLCHTNLVHGPRNDLWTPVWIWNDRLDLVHGGHEDHPFIDIIDIEKCRALFEELLKARIPVALQIEPLTIPFGALFAGLWDEGVSHQCFGEHDCAGDVVNGLLHLPDTGVTGPVLRNLGRLPKQHFIQRRVLTTITTKSHHLYHGIPAGIDNQPLRTVSVDLAAVEGKITYDDFEDDLESHRLVLAARLFPKQKTSQEKQSKSTSNSNAIPHVTPAAPDMDHAKTEIPDPIWRLNEIGDLVDDFRLIWHRSFAYAYTTTFAAHTTTPAAMNYPTLDWTEWSRILHKCKQHLRGRLWREAEYTALLFRRIPIDFPRLTRLALYIPAALYPDHDQTFINHALPGTGWTVKHYGPIGRPPPLSPLDEACLKFADDICPFIRRIFTRPAPTNDPDAVIVHNEEWHVTKRPMFDLDGEYKSMEQLLTEPLEENYTKGEN
ncbi:hypothetical protein IMSHALPRED_007844 [Imshaugia aleurites]|uniref:F-box domain-containing protein n=1 Tax=Imshaugia aleurites TaxID=172621 RepID=A0A8H3FTU0_9LECA|nr:hypothetical protein IMSHALPRED_007844 [Imshaugia aleurites]